MRTRLQDHFLAYHEGRLDVRRSTRLKSALTRSAALRAEYEEFVSLLILAKSVSSEKFDPGAGFADEVMSKLVTCAPQRKSFRTALNKHMDCRPLTCVFSVLFCVLMSSMLIVSNKADLVWNVSEPVIHAMADSQTGLTRSSTHLNFTDGRVINVISKAGFAIDDILSLFGLLFTTASAMVSMAFKRYRLAALFALMGASVAFFTVIIPGLTC
jgi:hypothetical protein